MAPSGGVHAAEKAGVINKNGCEAALLARHCSREAAVRAVPVTARRPVFLGLHRPVRLTIDADFALPHAFIRRYKDPFPGTCIRKSS